MQTLFTKANLLNVFLDNFINYDLSAFGFGGNDNDDNRDKIDTKSAEYVNKIAIRGIIMNCFNAIRLQASSISPSAFLPQYLSNNSRWNSFLPELRQFTEYQQTHAMGYKISDNRSAVTQQHLLSLSLGAQLDPDSDIDHGSRFAKSLGFVNEVAWPQETYSDAKSSLFRNSQASSNYSDLIVESMENYNENQTSSIPSETYDTNKEIKGEIIMTTPDSHININENLSKLNV